MMQETLCAPSPAVPLLESLRARAVDFAEGVSADLGGFLDGLLGRLGASLASGSHIHGQGAEVSSLGTDPFTRLSLQNGDFYLGVGRQSNAAMGYAAVGIVFLVVAGVLALYLLHHRRRVLEMRYRALESLARAGKLSGSELRELIDPSKRGLKAIVVLAWFGLFTGVMLMILSDSAMIDREAFMAGGILLALSLCTLSLPIMLRELKRQGVL